MSKSWVVEVQKLEAGKERLEVKEPFSVGMKEALGATRQLSQKQCQVLTRQGWIPPGEWKGGGRRSAEQDCKAWNSRGKVGKRLAHKNKVMAA